MCFIKGMYELLIEKFQNFKISFKRLANLKKIPWEIKWLLRKKIFSTRSNACEVLKEAMAQR